MDYSTLVSTIQAYTENDFPQTAGSGGLTSTEQLNTFIQQAEERIYNSVQIPDLRKSSTGTTTASTPYLSVPSDWLAAYSLAVVDSDGVYYYLINKDVSYIREAFPNPSTTGQPAYYAIFDDDSLILAPTPDDAYTVELHYFYYPETIVTATNTWLGDNFESVLLYGSLLEAYTFMKGEEDVLANYKARYDEALALLKQLAEGKNRQDAYRTQTVRYPVR